MMNSNSITQNQVSLSDYVGNNQIKSIIQDNIDVCNKKGSAFPHTIIYGISGTGKTTLARAIAASMNVHIEEVVCSKNINLLTTIIKLPDKSILFLDEIHSLDPSVMEYVLYNYMDSGIIFIKYPDGRTEPFELGREISIIAATTEIDKIPTPLLNRFTLNLKLASYTHEEMIQILKLNLDNHLNITEDAYAALANATRYIPRHAIQYCNIIRNFALQHDLKAMDKSTMLKALHNMGIDNYGLDSIDREYITTLYNVFSNNPTGIKQLTSMLGESESTIVSRENHLIREKLIVRTSRGRMLTPNGLRLAMEMMNGSKRR